MLTTALIVLGFLAYWFCILRGQVRPNVACWMMWVGLSTFRLFQWGNVPEFLERSALIFDTIGCVFTFLIVLLGKNRIVPKTIDWISTVSLFACLLMLCFSSGPEFMASATLGALFIISFMPMLRYGGSLRINSATEKPLPWLIWAASAVPDAWGQSKPFVLLNSGLAVILQVIVAYFAFRGRQNVASRTIPTANQPSG